MESSKIVADIDSFSADSYQELTIYEGMIQFIWSWEMWYT